MLRAGMVRLEAMPARSFQHLLRRYDAFRRRSSTDRTSISTRSFFLSAPNIAERLSIWGLPRKESIRWMLLLGLPINTDNDSNPTVALTKSRRRARAICGSPFSISDAASSNSARAKAGSSRRSSTVVSCASRKNGGNFFLFVLRIVIPLTFGTCTRGKVPLHA